TIIISIILFIIGYLVIYFAADIFLDNLKALSVLYGISPFVIGALLIGIDPEESIASVIAAINGLSNIAIGNVIGNSVFALTISFAIPTLFYRIEFKSIPQFYFILLYFCLFLIILEILLNFGIFFGILAILVYTLYLIRNIKQSFKETYKELDLNVDVKEDYQNKKKSDVGSKSKKIFLIIVSFISIFLGGELLIYASERIITQTNIPETFFGLVIIAFVTNVEELTLVIKSIKKKTVEIGLGGMIGKVIWNLTLTFGISSIFINNLQFLWILFWSWVLLSIIILYFNYSSRKRNLVKRDGIILIILLLSFLIINFTVVV
ncbi:MAG: sodium:calcium antiporter, partial [Candidatus Thorarchaeota archaeon]